MTDSVQDTDDPKDKPTANGAARVRELCLEHASDLIASAERVLRDNGFPNIAYHLAVLALEEIGKAGIIISRAAVGSARDTEWLNDRLDNHVWKIQWAVWAAGFASKRIDPKDFEEARHFAQSTHARRLAGLYVDSSGDGATVAPPRESVKMEHATSVINLARARLNVECAVGEFAIGGENSDLKWFLDALSDERGSKRLFSQSFVAKYTELDGDARAWIGWAREEFARVAADEQDHLKKELSRLPSALGQGKKKWLIKIRLRTPSHSIRPKVLTYWNNRVGWAKLSATKSKKEVLLELSLADTFSMTNIFDVGLSASKLCIVALNVGSLGYFWYELPGQTTHYYESIRDVDAPGMDIQVGRRPGLLDDWRQGALSEKNLQHAVEFMAVFSHMSDPEAAPIFGPYLEGLTLLSKSDIHLSCDEQARNAFIQALRGACRHFGDWDGAANTLIPSLHRVFQEIMPEESHRDLIFRILVPPHRSSEGPFADAISAKRITDLYLVLTADRLVSARLEQHASGPATE